MDPGASAELTIGNNAMNQAGAERLDLQRAKSAIKTTFDKERRGAGSDQTDSELKEGGTNVFGAISEYQSGTAVGKSVGRASAKVQATRQAIRRIGQGGEEAEQFITKSTAGTTATFLGGAHQMSEAGAEVDKIGSLFSQAASGTLRDGAEKGAGVGIPTIVSGLGKKIGVAEASADAVGDLVGHATGLGMAGVSGIEDIAGGWGKMDESQKVGNVLGIAGGIADTVGTFIPGLAPIGMALDVGSAIANWIGDAGQKDFQDKTKIDPAEKQADALATKDAGNTTSEAVQSSGLIANQGTASISTRTY